MTSIFRASWRELSFGFFIGIANTVPLLGRSLFIPGQLIAFVALAASFGLFLICRKNHRVGLRLVCAYALIAIYLALVAQSANIDQWAYLLQPLQWSRHADNYIRSKFVVFLVTALPPLAAGLMFSVLNERRAAFRGITIGIIAVSIIGLIVLVAASDGLYRSSYDAASDWYMGKNRALFSIISMGILLILGGVSSLFWLRSRATFSLAVAIFIGLCLLGVAMLIRRIDTVLFVVAVIVILSVYWLQRPTERRMLATTLAIMFAIPALAWPVVANEFSVAYWANFSSGYNSRAEAARTTIELLESGQTPQIANADKATVTLPRATSSQSWLWGNGLGYYASRSGDGLTYPHNLLLETSLESGPLAVAVFVGLLLILLLPIGGRFLIGTISRYEIVGSAAAVILFLASLKAGDMTSVGPIMFFAIAASSV